MSVREIHPDKNVIYFCSFTCFDWLNLFELTNIYDKVYNWFDILTKKECMINGYVIMPNHLHLLVFIPDKINYVNKLLANGKRFLAYDIIKRLELGNQTYLLNKLELSVSENDRTKGQKHRVFRSSFDAKPCFTEDFILQKLNYIHNNPVSGKWKLAETSTEYIHSSARFYELNEVGVYPVVDYRDILIN